LRIRLTSGNCTLRAQKPHSSGESRSYVQARGGSCLLVPRRLNFFETQINRGVGTNFGVGVKEARHEGPRSGGGVLGEGTASPSPPTRGLREHCKFPQRGPGRSPGHRRVFLYSEPSDCLSQHLSTCCIQFAWLGIRFSRGYTYQYPLHINRWGCQIPCILPASDARGHPSHTCRPDVRDRQTSDRHTSDAHHRLMPPGRGHNTTMNKPYLNN